MVFGHPLAAGAADAIALGVVGPEQLQRPRPLVGLQTGDDRRSAGQPGEGLARADDRDAHRARLQELVFDAATADERQDRRARLAHRRADVGQVGGQGDAGSPRQLAYRLGRLEAVDGERRGRHAAADGGPDHFDEVVERLDVRPEVEPAPEDAVVRLERRRGVGAVVVRVDAVGQEVDVGHPRQPAEGAGVGRGDRPDAANQAAVGALVQPLHQPLFQFHPGARVGELGLREVVPDPLVGRVPDADAVLDRAQVRQHVQPADRHAVGLGLGGDGGELADRRGRHAPVVAELLLPAGELGGKLPGGRLGVVVEREALREVDAGKRLARRLAQGGDRDGVPGLGECFHQVEGVDVVAAGAWPGEALFEEQPAAGRGHRGGTSARASRRAASAPAKAAALPVNSSVVAARRSGRAS